MDKSYTLTKRFTSLLTLLTVTLILGCALTSCFDAKEEIIGGWSPMKWNTEADMNQQGEVLAPSNGGTYVFTCTNYKHVWISEIWEKTQDGQKEVYPVNGENEDFHNIETSWGKVSVVKNVVTVQLYPNQSSNKREYWVSVTAGDIFFHFTFDQSGI